MGCHAQIPRFAPLTGPFGSAVAAALSIEPVIKNKRGRGREPFLGVGLRVFWSSGGCRRRSKANDAVATKADPCGCPPRVSPAPIPVLPAHARGRFAPNKVANSSGRGGVEIHGVFGKRLRDREQPGTRPQNGRARSSRERVIIRKKSRKRFDARVPASATIAGTASELESVDAATAPHVPPLSADRTDCRSR
jgi:hypothetical protein